MTAPPALRDTFGSYLLSNGIPLKCVSVQLRYASARVTERCYVNWIHDDKTETPFDFRLGTFRRTLWQRILTTI